LKVSPGVDGNVHVLYGGYMVEGIVKEEGVTRRGWGAPVCVVWRNGEGQTRLSSWYCPPL